jgi:hypothetical protein
MKFELKTENENYSKSFFSNFFKIFSILTLLLIFFDISLKLRRISRHYQIDYRCRLLSVEKSNSNFKELSKFTTLKNKQRIWEFCRNFLD